MRWGALLHEDPGVCWGEPQSYLVSMYARGICYTTALNANLIAMSEVLMAPLWALLLFGETVGAWAALGAGLMIVSILYETWFESRSEA